MIDRTFHLLRAERGPRARSVLPRAAAAAIAVVPAVIHFGWRSESPLFDPTLDHILQVIALLLYVAVFFGPRLRGGVAEIPRAALENRLETGTLALGVIFFWSWPILTTVVGVLFAMNIVRIFHFTIESAVISPALVFIGVFVGLIVLGAAALMLPISTPPEAPISLVDAAFTSTSAVCVTGLIVRDTASEFTRFGQTVILLLIQLGGLGIVVFGALLAVLLGPAFGIRASRAMAETTGEERLGPTAIKRLIAFIFALTLGTELVGAAIF
ncbi:MAG: potassium transporter TrkG, partial [Planctomycetota bacterium]|nr:potassium transporter TrkG [Planctomycetota bacterium]